MPRRGRIWWVEWVVGRGWGRLSRKGAERRFLFFLSLCLSLSPSTSLTLSSCQFFIMIWHDLNCIGVLLQLVHSCYNIVLKLSYYDDDYHCFFSVFWEMIKTMAHVTYWKLVKLPFFYIRKTLKTGTKLIHSIPRAICINEKKSLDKERKKSETKML